MRLQFSGSALCLLVATAACGPRHPPPDLAWQAGDHAGALERQRALAAEAGRDRTLENLRLASMALAEGDDALAEQGLRVAVSGMTTFLADGEFAAMVGQESRKEWKGEPYEKMAAFLTLGVLLHAGGDRGNALAMYKSAVLADTGTAEERYRSDFVPAWVMQALAYQAEGEAENARQYMERGVDALWSRSTLDVLSRALGRATVPGLSADDLGRARAVLLAALSAGVTARPRDPHEAVRATISYATDLLLEQREVPAKERLGGLDGFGARDFERAGEALPRLAESWTAEVGLLPPEVVSAGQAFADEMDDLLREAPGVVLLVERGTGPRKVRSGQYGELLTIVPGPRPASEPAVSVDGQPVAATWLDSATWQATTRGGRSVDGFLRGKAVYKDASMFTGYVLVEVADALARSDNDELATVAALLGCCLMLSSAATNPAADVRQWEFVPDAWYLVAGTWPPGDHALEVGGRAYTLRVPERGQLVGLVPALPPGGDSLIGRQ